MEGMNSCILKKQIYCEFDNFFLSNTISEFDNFFISNPMKEELFVEYIKHMINFYKTATSNEYLTFIELLERMIEDYNNSDKFQVRQFKFVIKKITKVDMLFDILSFFVGKTNARKNVYYV